MKNDPIRLFRALSDPLRVRILHLLRDDETCVGDLVEVLGVPQPTASRHLGYLRRVGLVSARTRGRWKFYGLARPRTAVHRRVLACVDACAGEIAELETDRARARALRAAGGCCPRAIREDAAAEESA